MLLLRGAEPYRWIQPDVAVCDGQLGLSLEGVGTSLDLEKGWLTSTAGSKKPEHGK